jgi:hypothetical protein
MKRRAEVGIDVIRREQAEANEKWLREYHERNRLPCSRPEDSVESWRPVVGFEGSYEVSNWGRVRSLWVDKARVRRPRRCPLVLTAHVNPETLYHSVTLVRGKGQHVTKNAHSLVLEAFVGPRPDGHVGGHRDGNGSNNRLSNLAWITYVENESDKRRHGRSPVGERNPFAKLTVDLVRAMRKDY